ncbi:hypothetical protein GCM10023323_38170 [Streptomyces thinghirensis]|uniref:Secreted protein n=1 Tax=Streptomyces thinghirensis TaxID=551547 RepID=A0ABP9T7C9_9ACTN
MLARCGALASAGTAVTVPAAMTAAPHSTAARCLMASSRTERLRSARVAVLAASSRGAPPEERDLTGLDPIASEDAPDWTARWMA